jgi:ABC-2 type transport system permease protein
METVSVTYTLLAPEKRPLGRTLAIFSKETKYEFLKLFRARAFSIATIGFPVMFYVLFGVVGDRTGGPHARYMLAGYACFGLIGSALFGVGVGMAGERGQGWLELKRSSPMPPPAYLFAKALTAGAFGLIILCVLTSIGLAFGGLHLTRGEFAHMALVAWLGSLPFAAMGMLLGLTMPAAAATGIVNLIYLPLSYCSGLWIPLPYLPHWIQKIAPASPMYHLVQLMQSSFHDGYRMQGTATGHILWLTAFTLAMLGGGWAVFQRAEQNA